MSKKVINQNANYNAEFLEYIESNFMFSEEPINRLEKTTSNFQENYIEEKVNKIKELTDLKEEISSIEDCSLKDNSKKVVLGDGNINSPIMLIGEAPGIQEDNTGTTFMGEVGGLLKKC